MKKLFKNPERGVVAHTPRRRAATVQEYTACMSGRRVAKVEKNIVVWCGTARWHTNDDNVLYVPHSDERQETRYTGQETRNKRREAPRQHPHVPHSAGEAGPILRKKINTVRPFLDTGIAER